MIFFNDEGSENGGLIFGGKRDAHGDVVDSGGSLSFDRYNANQVVQLLGVDDKDNRMAGMAVSDSQENGSGHRRLWVGRSADGSALLSLMDGGGKKTHPDEGGLRRRGRNRLPRCEWESHQGDQGR